MSAFTQTEPDYLLGERRLARVATGRAAIVIDDVVQPPWQPRGVSVRGLAEAVTDDRGARIRIHPDRVASWGLE